ncbi:MAG: sulfotransferase domain-containing protein [Actinomycetota bacterium]|nr:sulfotransferase domain-containing protein [Actinomycetota bacterium]
MGSHHLPNLLVAGVPKAGTGSLFAYLGQHPDICPSSEKEIGHFTALIANKELPSVKSYKAHFAHCQSERYLLEATPSYCYGGEPVLEAITQLLGTPHVIFSLRDPVERLWSAYTFQRSLGNLPGINSLQEYLEACEAQRRSGREFVVGSHLNGVSIGFYGDYLQQWFERFNDHVMVVFMEQVASQPQIVVSQICRWLEIDDAVTGSLDYGLRNKTVHPKSVLLSRLAFASKRRLEWALPRDKAIRARLRSAFERINRGELSEELDAETRRQVEDLYRASNQKVGELLSARGYERLPPWLSLK